MITARIKKIEEVLLDYGLGKAMEEAIIGMKLGLVMEEADTGEYVSEETILSKLTT